MFTTLNKIKAHRACEPRYKHLLECLGKTQADDEPLSIRTILEHNGVYDAIWALRAIEGHDKEIRLFACDCAESVLHMFEKHYPNDDRPRKAIDVARKYANGEASINELNTASDAARAAAWGAARAAAWAAAWAAAEAAPRDAAWAAYRVNRDSLDEKNIRELLLKYI